MTDKFADIVTRVESITEKLEGDDVPLEEAIAAYEEGMKLTREAQGLLEKAEQRVRVIEESGGHQEADPAGRVNETETT